ncbi:MAG TPA: nuclear transport factor 2 family protein [Terriglobales bacterium]
MKVAVALLWLTTLALAQTKDEQALLAIHQRTREAHLKGDAVLLTSDLASEIMDVGRGQFQKQTREQVREHFSTYFRQAKYASFEDLAAPSIHISADGSSAWMAVQVRAKITMNEPGKTPEQVDFQSAWLSTFEKQNGQWKMTAIAYSVPAGK